MSDLLKEPVAAKLIDTDREEYGAIGFDVWRTLQDFPILKELIYGRPLVYLDNAATSQKPQEVIDAMSRFYLKSNANVHRGMHYLAERATEEYEGVRTKVQRFLNAEHASELIFVRGTTEAINLVAQTYGKGHVGSGDEVLITAMEHHSNIVPWQMLCEEKGAHLRIAPINDAGDQARGRHTRLERARHHQSHPVHRRDGARARCARPSGRGTGDASSQSGRTGVGLRFLRAVRPQDVWPHRYRRSLRPERAP